MLLIVHENDENFFSVYLLFNFIFEIYVWSFNVPSVCKKKFRTSAENIFFTFFFAMTYA